MTVYHPTFEQLQQSNIRVRNGPREATRRIVPIERLRDTIERYLPPAGQYYDQSTLDDTSKVYTHIARCIFCWIPKHVSQRCECRTECALCNTTQHAGRECPKLYAGITWWRKRDHRPKSTTHIRPNPAERAYLMIAGVFHTWNSIDDPVNVNMEHPVVKKYYAGKQAPKALEGLSDSWSGDSVERISAASPSGADVELSVALGDPVSTPPYASSELGAVPETPTAHAVSNAKHTGPGSVPSPKPHRNTKSPRDRDPVRGDNTSITRVQDAGSESHPKRKRSRIITITLGKPWTTPSYHEGSGRATPIPRTESSSSKATEKRLSPVDNKIHLGCDRSLHGRTHHISLTATRPLTPLSLSPPPASQSPPLVQTSYEICLRQRKYEMRKLQRELEEARNEIVVNKRRIRELELEVLSDGEGEGVEGRKRVKRDG